MTKIIVSLFAFSIGCWCQALTVPSTAHHFYNSQGSKSSSLNSPVISSDLGISSTSDWSKLTGSSIGGSTPSVSATRYGLSSPTQDGGSNTVSLYNSGSSSGYADVMWTRTLMSSVVANNFVMDMWIKIDKPSNVQALEIAALKREGYNWFKLSTQCNYRSGEFRGYDPVLKKWVYLNAPCVKASANTWQHLVFEFQILNGKSHFNAISFNGVRYPIAMDLNPAPESSTSQSFGIHFQTDTIGSANAGYIVYVDNWKVYFW